MENNNHNNPLLSVLTREGVLVKVSVSYFRGCKKLKPEDVGLEKKNQPFPRKSGHRILGLRERKQDAREARRTASAETVQ